MKILRSGIEVTPEELKESRIGKWVNHCCPPHPTGCSGQPGSCIDWHIPGSDDRGTMPNHQE